MDGGLLIHLWERWDIQILVLFSFILQVILLVFAEIRRRRVPMALRAVLWFAYQMADSVAIYALGHMSLSSRSQEQQLVAFWAPLLLLHLGGPDTITAYASEDNKLWLRHLQTLVVQVLGAAYVLYLGIAFGSAGTLVPAPAVALLFVTGFLKYSERTWALRCADMASIGSSLDEPVGRLVHGREMTRLQILDSEEVLLEAHYMLNVCKSQFVDALRMKKPEYEAVDHAIELKGDIYLYDLVEMELSLMYDILYTKAAVLHTWYGCCIRVISLPVTAAAFLLFQFSSKDAYSIVDVAVTYALLVGALALETTTACRALGSSWMCHWLHARGWHRLRSAAMRLRRLVKAASNRTCLDSIGQYNMLDFCTRNTGELRGRIAKKIGLEDWWNALQYSTTAPVTPLIKDLVLREIRRRGGKEDIKNARGKWALEQRGLYADLGWSIGGMEEFHQSILVWHLATDYYLHRCNEEEAPQQLANAIKVLSNYMLYLLVVHPYLLPGVVRQSRYKENCHYLTKLWLSKDSTKQYRNSPAPIKSKELAILEVPDRYIHPPNQSDDHGTYRVDGRAYVDAQKLAAVLLRNKWKIPVADMLEVIAQVWVEMLCYAGHHCSEDSHARKLSSGCEFVTAVWLLVGHVSMYDEFKKETSSQNIIPAPGYTVSLVGISERPNLSPTIWEQVPNPPTLPSAEP